MAKIRIEFLWEKPDFFDEQSDQHVIGILKPWKGKRNPERQSFGSGGGPPSMGTIVENVYTAETHPTGLFSIECLMNSLSVMNISFEVSVNGKMLLCPTKIKGPCSNLFEG